MRYKVIPAAASVVLVVGAVGFADTSVGAAAPTPLGGYKHLVVI